VQMNPSGAAMHLSPRTLERAHYFIDDTRISRGVLAYFSWMVHEFVTHDFKTS